MAQTYYVYILQSVSRRVLYIGVTRDIERRIFQHKTHALDGFAAKYHCERLVYFERYGRVHDAIRREKQLKGWRREKKERLIVQVNPHWKDLSKEWWEELERVWSAWEKTMGPSIPVAKTAACAQDDRGTKGPST